MARVSPGSEDDATDVDFEVIPGTGMINSQNALARPGYQGALTIHHPRSIEKVQKNCLLEAELAGDDFYYSWKAGGDLIEGPSIGCIMSALRCWGNCALETLPVQETATSFIFTTRVMDHETGFSTERQFKQSKKSMVHGKLDAERKEDMRFQIGQSKANRNAGKAFLPSWLVNKMLERAKDGARVKLEENIKKYGVAGVQDSIMKALRKVGVTDRHVCELFEIASYKALDTDQMVKLKSFLSSFDRGEVRVEDVFPDVNAEGYESKAKKPEDKKVEEKKEESKTTSNDGEIDKKESQPESPAVVLRNYEDALVKLNDKDSIIKLHNEVFHPDSPVKFTQEHLDEGKVMRDSRIRRVERESK